MQTSAKGTYTGMLDCAGGILKHEGPLAFYKVGFFLQFTSFCGVFMICLKQGTLTPLLGIGVCVSIQFAALEHTKRFFARQNLANSRGGPDGLTLTAGQLMAAGVFAGLANSVVSGPVEHIRIRAYYSVLLRFTRGIRMFLTSASTGLQTQSATKPVFTGPLDAIKKIASSHGIAGIYKGQVATLWREATGYGVYFMVYELLMQREMKQKGIRRDQVSPANAVLYGAAAGYAVRQPRVLVDRCSD